LEADRTAPADDHEVGGDLVGERQQRRCWWTRQFSHSGVTSVFADRGGGCLVGDSRHDDFGPLRIGKSACPRSSSCRTRGAVVSDQDA
jgi:hypothetical protein